MRDIFQEKVNIRNMIEEVRKVCKYHNTSCNYELLAIKNKLYTALEKSHSNPNNAGVDNPIKT